jgi:hypothetical protein
MDHIRTAIDAATNGDANAFRDGIHQALAAKMHDAIELKKIEVASSFFKEPEASSIETEIPAQEISDQ